MGFRTLLALAYGTLFRKPVWVWWGGTLHTERDIPAWKKHLRSLLARWAKHWISYGKTSTEYLCTLGVPVARILEIQNNVDETWFLQPVLPALSISPKPVLLHVGQMIARKGVAELLNAAARVQAEGKEFSLVLLGDGADTEALRNRARALCLKNVHFYPAQRPEIIPSFYRSADALIFPTMEDVWGLVANEGVLSGLPVLCSKHAGCAPELFDSEAIFDPANEEEFANGLRKAIAGRLPRPDPSRLLRTEEVAKRIVEAIRSSIGKQAQSSTGTLGPESVSAKS
jgi:glycosyltransferase involved in cell wall biosynthesis